MGVGELLDKIRDYYLVKLSDEMNLIGSDGLIVEPEYRDETGEVVTEGFFDAGSRVDLAVSKDGEASKSFNVDTEEMISFEALSFDWETTLKIKLNPFQWNYCPIELIGDKLDWKPIANWYQKWFQENPTEESKFFDCVHFISDPEKTKNGQRVYIDFGTASVTSFEELLDSFIIAGVNEVEIGSV
jgi:hypothetical protein